MAAPFLLGLGVIPRNLRKRNSTPRVSSCNQESIGLDSEEAKASVTSGRGEKSKATAVSYDAIRRDPSSLIREFSALVNQLEKHCGDPDVRVQVKSLCSEIREELTRIFREAATRGGHESQTRKLQQDFRIVDERLEKLSKELTKTDGAPHTPLQNASSCETSASPGFGAGSTADSPCLAIFTGKTDASISHYTRPIPVWENELEISLRKLQLKELKSIETDLLHLRNLQHELAKCTDHQGEGLSNTENQISKTVSDTRQANLALARASKAKSRWWGMQGSGAGALAGGLIGIALGPVGIAAGASIGGALGLLAGHAMHTKRKIHLNRIIAGGGAVGRQLEGEGCGDTSSH